MKEARSNFSQSDIVPTQPYMYPCSNPSVIDDFIGQFMVNDENVRDLSKHVSYKDFQPPKHDETQKLKKGKNIIDKSIETFLNESHPNLSKQIELHSPSTYGSVQSHPMQLTLSNNDKHKNKANSGIEKEYSYILDSCIWPDSVRKTAGTSTQTEPLQLTSVTKPETLRKPKARRDLIPASKKKRDSVFCEVCHKKFSTLGSLREHMRLHTGERPFKCDECEATFTTKSNLTTHKRMHTGEKPFMCAICKRGFSQSTHLSAHAKTHNREPSTFFKCHECGKLLRSKITLKNHMKNHSGERPFTCAICNHSFACKAYLKDHQLVHSNKRPYQCEICKKSFKEKSYVTIHKRKFCGNNGYVKRWQDETAKKPPGRKRSAKSVKSGGIKRPRGRPKSRKKKKVRKKIQNDPDTQSDLEFEDLIGDQEVIETATKPLALTSDQDKNISDKAEKSNEVIIDDYSLVNLSSQQDPTEQDLQKPDDCSTETFLGIHLTDESILDFTKPENLTLSHCFSEPQNLTIPANALNESHCIRSSADMGSFQLSDSVHESDQRFSQPQNLCLPQNLCINQSNCQSPIQPQNLSLPSKIPHNIAWDINSLQEESLSQPQNLSMPQNLPQGQNSTPKPQNLSRPSYPNISQGLNQNQIHSLSNLAHSTLNVPSMPQHTFGSPHDFAQPQNLSQSHCSLSEDSSMQPQNLSVPHNMSFTNISVPHNLSHDMQALPNLQPENLTQSHLTTNPIQSMDLPQSSSLQVLYYS